MALKAYMLMLSNMKGGRAIFITLSGRAGEPGEV